MQDAGQARTLFTSPLWGCTFWELMWLETALSNPNIKGGDDVGGVPVEGHPGPVVAHGGARIGVAGRFLHVAQRHAGVEGGGDEGVPQRVRADPLGDPGPARDPADDPARGVAVEAPTVGPRKIGPSQRSPMARSIARAVRGASGNGDDLAALAQDRQGAVPALEAERLDVGAGGLRDPQPVEGQQRDQGVLGGLPRPAATSSAPTSLRSSPVACDS